MGFIEEFIPFYPKKSKEKKPPRPKFDLDRALRVVVRPHPSLREQRAANGELIVSVERHLHPTERLLARFIRISNRRRVVLDKYGEFLLRQAASREAITLGDAADKMAAEFGLDRETARIGAVHLVRDLLIRGVVFLVQPNAGGEKRQDDITAGGSGSGNGSGRSGARVDATEEDDV